MRRYHGTGRNPLKVSCPQRGCSGALGELRSGYATPLAAETSRTARRHSAPVHSGHLLSCTKCRCTVHVPGVQA